MTSASDHKHMGRALMLAARGRYTTDPNPRVGCVLVRNGEVVGEGWHERAGGPHAEINALRAAGVRAAGATAYVTLEPCCHHGRTPPCTEALIAAGVQRVIAAMEDPNPRVGGTGFKTLQAAGIEVHSGVMRAEAERLNPGFVMRMRQGRPWVRCKLAMSLDGRTAMASGESRWITGEDARRDVHRWRALSSAIMTGVGTVLADDPSLTVRLGEDESGSFQQPLRVILDTHLRTPPGARMLSLPGETLILTGMPDRQREARLEGNGISVVTLPMDGSRLDLAAVMAYLGRMEINEVHLEAGATLSGALLAVGRVDELLVYLAPHLLGDAGRGLFTLPGLERMEQRIGLSISDIRAVGRDWRITASVNQ